MKGKKRNKQKKKTQVKRYLFIFIFLKLNFDLNNFLFHYSCVVFSKLKNLSKTKQKIKIMFNIYLKLLGGNFKKGFFC